MKIRAAGPLEPPGGRLTLDKEPTAMIYTIECEQEDKGRWLAEVMELPGVLAYGASKDDAIVKAETLALRVIAERLEHGESKRTSIRIALPAAA